MCGSILAVTSSTGPLLKGPKPPAPVLAHLLKGLAPLVKSLFLSKNEQKSC